MYTLPAASMHGTDSAPACPLVVPLVVVAVGVPHVITGGIAGCDGVGAVVSASAATGTMVMSAPTAMAIAAHR